jgi:hypothetical protein
MNLSVCRVSECGAVAMWTRHSSASRVFNAAYRLPRTLLGSLAKSIVVQ